MLILGIETSCDETAAAVVQDGHRVLSDVVASQVLVHAEYGGVVPEVASRQHLATVVPTVRAAIDRAGVNFDSLDGIAVTCGPGLVGALLVGVETAKALGYALNKPVIGVNHHAGHMAAAFLDVDDDVAGARSSPRGPQHPHVALLVSGGHTALFYVQGHGHPRGTSRGRIRMLGTTRDDAAGEAFDKVAKMLGLGYPGGIAIDRLAAGGDPQAHDFPRALRGRDDLDFSFSGLKTAVATRLQQIGEDPPVGRQLADLAASFQAAVVDVLVRKARRAVQREAVSDLVVCGGVAANRGLRAALQDAAAQDGFGLHIPPPRYCTDNAAMIAAAGYFRFVSDPQAGHVFLDLGVDPGLSIEGPIMGLQS